MNLYTIPTAEIVEIRIEECILSGENGSSETTREEEGDIFG